MRVLESTRSLNDACEIKRQLIQQEAPLRFRLALSPSDIDPEGAPIDSTARVYRELTVPSPFFQGQITHDKSRINLHVPGLGIPTIPSQITGPLLAEEDVRTLGCLISHPAHVNNTCGRFTTESRVEALVPERAFFNVPDLPLFPLSTRSDQRQYWAGCQDKFTRDLKDMPRTH